MSTRLIPHTVYLPLEAHEKLRQYAAERQSSTRLREAVMAYLNGSGTYEAGYLQALKDADRSLSKVDALNRISYDGEKISDIIFHTLNFILENRDVQK